jgi:hypothetical protein
MAQYDAMIIRSTQQVEPPRPDMSAKDRRLCRRVADPVISGPGEAQLVIAAAEYQADGAIPGVVVQTAIGVGIDESMQVGMPAAQPKPVEARNIVALEVGLALLAVDDTAREMVSDADQ